ncbi:phage baseplate protein [Pseudanabaena sp. FACHB-2040]|uniref:T4 family baseplate hub assembly chaperone n=1 Tax=Pseudanabaena sp. FACHB-2040 TaxID=2692859 RepID=UPI0016881C6D|nr:phage baseplate protein [Pseudanabaena sp. FACHB-2040]MBD2261421.1 phage baseplate protein [Pseudanabaena sp. FACHB-2040]
MHSLTALELLQVWEQGFSASPVCRAMYLLAIAHPYHSWEALTQLSIGRRDALLLSLREQLFGPAIASVSHCPQCSEPLELNFSVADVRVLEGKAESEETSSLLPPLSSQDSFSLKADDYAVQFRLPNSLDLEAVAGCADLAEAQQLLLEGCVLKAQYQGADCPVAELPQAAVDAIAKAMAEGDPQANVQIALSCPACSHQWSSTFDIVHFVWGELHAWAQRTLVEVHRLALAYGWREADILAMSPQRRQLYLEMVQR